MKFYTLVHKNEALLILNHKIKIIKMQYLLLRFHGIYLKIY